METYMFILLILSSVMTLAPAGAWAGQIAVLISLADLVMLQYVQEWEHPAASDHPTKLAAQRIRMFFEF